MSDKSSVQTVTTTGRQRARVSIGKIGDERIIAKRTSVFGPCHSCEASTQYDVDHNGHHVKVCSSNPNCHSVVRAFVRKPRVNA